MIHQGSTCCLHVGLFTRVDINVDSNLGNLFTISTSDLILSGNLDNFYAWRLGLLHLYLLAAFLMMLKKDSIIIVKTFIELIKLI